MTDQWRSLVANRARHLVDTRYIVLGTLVLVAIRVAVLIYLTRNGPAALLGRDAHTYLEPARSLISSGSFTAADGQPVILRTPGYPLFLAPFVAIFGQGAPTAVALAQILLTVATAILAFQLVKVLADGNGLAAVCAYMIVLVAPSVFMAGFYVETEIVFLALLTLAVLCIIKGWSAERPTFILLGFVILAIDTYVRPLGLYLPIVLGLVLLAAAARRRRWETVATVLAGCVLALGITTAWKLRNEHIFGVRTFTSVAGLNMYEYIGSAVQARSDGRGWEAVRREFHSRMQEYPGNEAQIAQREWQLGKAIVLSHPVAAAEVGIKGLLTNLFDPGTGGWANILGLRRAHSGVMYKYVSMRPWTFVAYLWSQERALMLFVMAGFVWIGFFWAFVMIGVLSMRSRWTIPMALLVITAAYLLVMAAGPQSEARFRAPAIPFLAVFAGLGAAHTLRRVIGMRSSRTANRPT